MSPVKNEAWILPSFLAAVSLWADVIIVADQGSTDGSVEIARSFPKVVLVANNTSGYSEAARQRMLLEKAREQSGRLILVALDADEFLTPALASDEWFSKLAATGPGAHAMVPFFNVKPGFSVGWVGHREFVAAWVDNARDHLSTVIHSRRLPVNDRDHVVLPPPGAAVMHFQFVAPARVRSKHCWYLAWERLHRPERSAVRVYREYHHMNAVTRRELKPMPLGAVDWYGERGIDLKKIADDGRHWWNAEVLFWMRQYGADYFAREAIWLHNWEADAADAGLSDAKQYADPRNWVQKIIHTWLRLTQRFHRSFPIRLGDKLCRLFFDGK